MQTGQTGSRPDWLPVRSYWVVVLPGVLPEVLSAVLPDVLPEVLSEVLPVPAPEVLPVAGSDEPDVARSVAVTPLPPLLPPLPAVAESVMPVLSVVPGASTRAPLVLEASAPAADSPEPGIVPAAVPAVPGVPATPGGVVPAAGGVPATPEGAGDTAAASLVVGVVLVVVDWLVTSACGAVTAPVLSVVAVLSGVVAGADSIVLAVGEVSDSGAAWLVSSF